MPSNSNGPDQRKAARSRLGEAAACSERCPRATAALWIPTGTGGTMRGNVGLLGLPGQAPARLPRRAAGSSPSTTSSTSAAGRCARASTSSGTSSRATTPASTSAATCSRARARSSCRAGVEEKKPKLLANGAFEFGKLGRTFDYAIAQSVFTHLPLNNIMRCLVEMAPRAEPRAAVLRDDLREPAREAVPRRHRAVGAGRLTTTATSSTTTWTRSTSPAEGTGLTMSYEGDFGHPDNQKMVVFVRAADV